MTKVLENGNGRTELVISPETEEGKKSTNYFFSLPVCDFSLEKTNLPENTIFYINQGYLSYKDNKKFYYNDVFIIGQITPLLNQPQNIEEYVPKQVELKILRPKYDAKTGTFLSIEYCLAYETVRNDLQEQFFDYGY